MPFPGIKPGSELEQKIDRCLSQVLQKNPKFSKSQGIAVCRASIAGTTTKRSRGPAEQKAMFAKMGASGKLKKKVGGKRTGAELPPDKKTLSTQRVQRERPSISKEEAEFIAELNAMGTPPSVQDTIRREGRAPTGQGKEYQTRNWAANRLDNMEARRDRLRRDISKDRGQKRSQGEISRKKIVLKTINETIEVTQHVIQNLVDTGSSFADAKALLSELLSLPAGMMRGKEYATR